MKSVGYKLMVDYGNSYAVPYADAIVNMPTHGSSYYIVDEEIPFIKLCCTGWCRMPENRSTWPPMGKTRS